MAVFVGWCSVLRSPYEMTAWGIVHKTDDCSVGGLGVDVYRRWIREVFWRCKETSIYGPLAKRWRHEGDMLLVEWV